MARTTDLPLRIYNYLKDNPGSRTSKIARELNSTPGAIRYNLKTMLENGHVIVSHNLYSAARNIEADYVIVKNTPNEEKNHPGVFFAGQYYSVQFFLENVGKLEQYLRPTVSGMEINAHILYLARFYVAVAQMCEAEIDVSTAQTYVDQKRVEFVAQRDRIENLLRLYDSILGEPRFNRVALGVDELSELNAAELGAIYEYGEKEEL